MVPKNRNLYRRLIVDAVVNKSHQIITVSNFEKQNISNVCGLDDSKIQTVHNGVNASFTTEISASKKDNVRKKYNLPNQFLLHIGNTDPRKNTARVLKAFNRYVNTLSKDTKLVLVGLDNTKLNIILKNLDLENELADKIVLTGYVSDKDLPVIFNLSEVFYFHHCEKVLEYRL